MNLLKSSRANQRLEGQTFRESVLKPVKSSPAPWLAVLLVYICLSLAACQRTVAPPVSSDPAAVEQLREEIRNFE